MPAAHTQTRSSGVLLHPTSLPGPFGIGDLGPQAHAWLDALSLARQQWWQVLPVGPTGYGDSPYQSPSTFAGNLNLISPELLLRDGLVSIGDLGGCELACGPVQYSAVIPRKQRLVSRACERFRAGDGESSLRSEYDQFRAAEAGWLDDYALFAALKDAHNGAPWWEWPALLARRDEAALRAARESFADEIAAHHFGQFLFFRQWAALRVHAHNKGVRIIGDLPIYVAEDSADVWTNPHLFLFDADRRPTVVAGVPPDYFSQTGQLWGNPIYDWPANRWTGFVWWIERVRSALRQFDLVRFDHFRGLQAYWAVPYGDTTAERGEWRPGPGALLLNALDEAIGSLPIIAEDLGFITPEVETLRERFELPGMRVLQFAFGGAVEERFLPHRFERNVVAYTGTHDNDTTRGWFEKLSLRELKDFLRYAPDAAEDPVGAMIRLAWGSVADLAIAPLQDVLNLDSESRLNTPGTGTHNWRWRADPTVLASPDWIVRLREFTEVYERAGTGNGPA